MKDNTMDMTTGNPVRHIILFALPSLFGSIFQQVYNLADSMIVGRFVGPDALASVGATSSITFLFFALCNGIGGGGGIIVSQYFGAHKYDRVRNCIVNTGFIMLLVPLIFGITGFLSAKSLLTLLSTPENIISDSVSYTRILCLGLIFVSIYNFVASMLKALGDSRSPLYFLIMSTVINVILDLIMVCYFRQGIRGAAYATVISQFLAMITSFLFALKNNPFFKFKKEDFSITLHMSFKVIRLGVPLSLQFGLIAISSMAVQRIVNSYGSVVVAAFTATNRIEQLIHQPYMILGTSLSTYCGQNYGARRYDRVYEGYKKSLYMMLLLSVIMIVSMQLFGENLTSLFVSDPSVIELGGMGLKITSLFYPALGLIYIVRGILMGASDAFFALFNGIVEVAGRFTIPLIMTGYMGFGIPGIWWSAGIVWVLSGSTAWLRYYVKLHKTITGVSSDTSGDPRN
ncbi:MAG: MATE family efflux transporter [Lachnospiraceae bacterium]|nr:MATE family efflux transporter [Lachnospiraceae bacterium]